MDTYMESTIKRFWSKVAIAGPDDCWRWLGSHYGNLNRACFNFDYKQVIAARFAYYITTGIDPGKFCVCHSCDNPLCVNPKHLWLGTQADNVLDAVSKGHTTKGRTTVHTPKKLTEDKVREIRAKREAGCSRRQLALEYGVTTTCVDHVVKRRSWKHVD